MNHVELTRTVSPVTSLEKPIQFSLSQVTQPVLSFPLISTMILLALGGLCVSVGFRTQHELQQAHRSQMAVQQQLTSKQIEFQKLNREVQDLTSNPVCIEHAARKMGMVKQNEVVVILPEASCVQP